MANINFINQTTTFRNTNIIIYYYIAFYQKDLSMGAWNIFIVQNLNLILNRLFFVIIYLYRGTGYDWAGHNKARDSLSFPKNMPTLSLISTLGATEPTGSEMLEAPNDVNIKRTKNIYIVGSLNVGFSDVYPKNYNF